MQKNGKKGRYNLLWENHYSWIASVQGDKHKAFSKLCLKTFQIDGSGISLVKSHEKTNIHKKIVLEIREH